MPTTEHKYKLGEVVYYARRDVNCDHYEIKRRIIESVVIRQSSTQDSSITYRFAERIDKVDEDQLFSTPEEALRDYLEREKTNE